MSGRGLGESPLKPADKKGRKKTPRVLDPIWNQMDPKELLGEFWGGGLQPRVQPSASAAFTGQKRRAGKMHKQGGKYFHDQNVWGETNLWKYTKLFLKMCVENLGFFCTGYFSNWYGDEAANEIHIFWTFWPSKQVGENVCFSLKIVEIM